MLQEIGYSSFADLYTDVPPQVLYGELAMPKGLSELEVRDALAGLAAKNTVFGSIFRGAGAYNRYIPSLVKTVTGKEEFVTAYTPYQAEISQGVLQSIFEFQSMVCELTGLDVANASVYDGATAAAEAVFMCQERKRSKIVVSATVNPQTIATMRTYSESRGVQIVEVPAAGGVTDADALAAALDDGTAGVFLQQPNFYGNLEDCAALFEAAHAAGAKAVLSFEPISLGVLASPAELGADIAVAEGQPLGLPMSFGGPYLGIIACTTALMRKLPGRIVGQTTDDKGNRAFVLTLQAREQHIRREKALSNICSNEALCALAAGVYLACMGPAGLANVARSGYLRAHQAASAICAVQGFKLAFNQPFFNEFVTTSPLDGQVLEAELAKRGILGGLPLELADGRGGILWCATELNSAAQIEELALALADIVKEGGAK